MKVPAAIKNQTVEATIYVIIGITLVVMLMENVIRNNKKGGNSELR